MSEGERTVSSGAPRMGSGQHTMVSDPHESSARELRWAPDRHPEASPAIPGQQEATVAREYTYTDEASRLAASRGFDRDAHVAALEGGDDDAIALTHPFNWLTEAEVEQYPDLDGAGFPDDALYLSSGGDTVTVDAGRLVEDPIERVAGVPVEDASRCGSYGYPGLRCTLDAGHTQKHANLSDRWS